MASFVIAFISDSIALRANTIRILLAERTRSEIYTCLAGYLLDPGII